MTDIRSLEQTLIDNLPWNRARIKFVARFLLALYAVRTVNLSILATAFSGSAKEESNYKRLQRFLRNFEMPYAQLAEFVIKLLGIPGPYTLALDRTNWKVGTVDINILMLSIVYRGVGFPVVWSVLPNLALILPNAAELSAGHPHSPPDVGAGSVPERLPLAARLVSDSGFS